jgi:hypothetical protein
MNGGRKLRAILKRDCGAGPQTHALRIRARSEDFANVGSKSALRASVTSTNGT